MVYLWSVNRLSTLNLIKYTVSDKAYIEPESEHTKANVIVNSQQICGLADLVINKFI